MLLPQNRYRPANDAFGSFAFTVPHEVATDPVLSMDQKRTLLSRWASDACAVKSFPTLRHLPGTPFPVTFASIMDARALLDRMEDESRFPVSLAARRKRGSGNQTGA